MRDLLEHIISNGEIINTTKPFSYYYYHSKKHKKIFIDEEIIIVFIHSGMISLVGRNWETEDQEYRFNENLQFDDLQGNNKLLRINYILNNINKFIYLYNGDIIKNELLHMKLIEERKIKIQKIKSKF